MLKEVFIVSLVVTVVFVFSPISFAQSVTNPFIYENGVKVYLPIDSASAIFDQSIPVDSCVNVFDTSSQNITFSDDELKYDENIDKVSGTVWFGGENLCDFKLKKENIVLLDNHEVINDYSLDIVALDKSSARTECTGVYSCRYNNWINRIQYRITYDVPYSKYRNHLSEIYLRDFKDKTYTNKYFETPKTPWWRIILNWFTKKKITLKDEPITGSCDDFRAGKTTFLGYEEKCGTLLENGLIKLGHTKVILRKSWGPSYSVNNLDICKYNYFIITNINSPCINDLKGKKISQIFSSIVIHHTTDSLYQDIKELEKKEHEKFDVMPYHFIIDGNGKVYEGRPLEFKGDNVKQDNSGRIGIALMGDFQRDYNTWFPDTPTEKQIKSLEMLIKDLQQDFDVKTKSVIGHKDVPNMYTECPGDNLYPLLIGIRKKLNE